MNSPPTTRTLMSIDELLNTIDHRPWEKPRGSWMFYQEWNEVLFLHWQVDLEELKRFVPSSLEVELFEGRAWVSLVVFSMEKVRPNGLPSWSFVSDFPEINIRTYVKRNNKPGVYFLSIEAASWLSCWIARRVSHLPYRHSNISKTRESLVSGNRQRNEHLSLSYRPDQHLTNKTPLDKWLTERYALFHDYKNGINRFEIHHREWPIHKVELTQLEFRYPRFEKLLQNAPIVLHYSPGVQVLTWNKQRSLISEESKKISL